MFARNLPKTTQSKLVRMDPEQAMTPSERRTVLFTSLLISFRFLGIFLVLPLLSAHASSLPGFQNATLVGLAFGSYGLAQALFHLPFGAASDRLGRKPVIIFGLIITALGSISCAFASNIWILIASRALQGSGAISSAVTALVADCTREKQRTKAMAFIGGSIGLTFSISLVLAPVLHKAVGMSGIFLITAALAIFGIIAVILGIDIPPTTKSAEKNKTHDLAISWKSLDIKKLFHLYYGIFVLHATQLSLFVIAPIWLIQYSGLSLNDHWQVYLPVVLASFGFMLYILSWGRKKDKNKEVLLYSILVLFFVEISLSTQPQDLLLLSAILLVFFIGFNILEASLPSLISQEAPINMRGAALGIYNTMQSLGLFFGGILGGWTSQQFGQTFVFIFCSLLMLSWFFLSYTRLNGKNYGIR